MGKNKERLQAQDLYINSSMTKKEIAKTVNVSAKTITDWARRYNWEELRTVKRVSRDQLRQNTYNQLARIDREIEENHGGIPTKALSDAQAVCINKLKQFENLPLQSVISVFSEFTDFLRFEHPNKLQEWSELMNEFVEAEASKKRIS